MFVNHGRFPHELVQLSESEKAMVLAMALKEINSRPKKRKGV